MTITNADEVRISTNVLGVLMNNVPENMFANEAVRNAEQYGASMCVLSPVWSAVEQTGNYTLGIWSDSVFEPERMGRYMPVIGETEVGHGASVNGNFHAGSRLSILAWADLAVVSRPDPSKPDEAYITFLYESGGRYLHHKWARGADSDLSMSKVVNVADVTDDEIVMLGFDPADVVSDPGWVNRLEAEGLKFGQVPVTCFVLVGRDGGVLDTYQGQTGTGRPLTRSVINDRFWKPDVAVWAWEVQNPDQRDQWLTAPPDGSTVNWKVDGSHQWRRQHGLSQIVAGGSGARRDAPEIEETVLLDDGTTITVYVLPLTDKGKSPLDNAAYDVVRRGGYIIDFQGENYHTGRGPRALRRWNIWNQKIALRTLIRVVPPVWDDEHPFMGGVSTDLARANLHWQHGPSRVDIGRKIDDWQVEFRDRMNAGELPALREAMSGAEEAYDPDAALKDLRDLMPELGKLYTRRERVKVQVSGEKDRKKRRRREMVCTECGRKLPRPGHAPDCSLKPAPRPPSPPRPPRPTPPSGDKNTTEVEKEIEIPVSFPDVKFVEWDAISSKGYQAVSFTPGEGDGVGTIRVAWGSGQDETRYPSLRQALDRLLDKHGVAPDNEAAVRRVEVALRNVVHRVLAAKFAHIAGQVDAGNFARDDEVENFRETTDHPVITYGLTTALYGIQDLERFVSPILAQTLSGSIASS